MTDKVGSEKEGWIPRRLSDLLFPGRLGVQWLGIREGHVTVLFPHPKAIVMYFAGYLVFPPVSGISVFPHVFVI